MKKRSSASADSEVVNNFGDASPTYENVGNVVYGNQAVGPSEKVTFERREGKSASKQTTKVTNNFQGARPRYSGVENVVHGTQTVSSSRDRSEGDREPHHVTRLERDAGKSLIASPGSGSQMSGLEASDRQLAANWVIGLTSGVLGVIGVVAGVLSALESSGDGIVYKIFTVSAISIAAYVLLLISLILGVVWWQRRNR